MNKVSMVAGEQFEITFTVKMSGVAEDLTGWTAKIDLRKSSSSGSLIESWDDDSAELTRVDESGVVKLTIPANITNAYDFNLGFMDLLLLHESDGRRSTALQIQLNRGVTR